MLIREVELTFPEGAAALEHMVQVGVLDSTSVHLSTWCRCGFGDVNGDADAVIAVTLQAV